MGTQQIAVKGGGGLKHGIMVRENDFWSGESQGISFQTKSGHPGVDIDNVIN